MTDNVNVEKLDAKLAELRAAILDQCKAWDEAVKAHTPYKAATEELWLNGIHFIQFNTFRCFIIVERESYCGGLERDVESSDITDISNIVVGNVNGNEREQAAAEWLTLMGVYHDKDKIRKDAEDKVEQLTWDLENWHIYHR